MATVESKLKALGLGPPGSVLRFGIQETSGFVATARLNHDDDVVAKWKSDEIVGQVIEEPLVLAGAYKLEILITVFAKNATDLHVDVALVPPGKQPSIQTVTFRQKKAGDVCEALVFAGIQ